MKPYYQHNGTTIYCGDCLKIMPQLVENSIDLIAADLPNGTTDCEWDAIIPFEPLWKEYERVVKPNGAIVLFGNQPFTSMLILSNLPWFRYCWIWEKNTGTRFLDANERPLNFHEEIAVFYDRQPTYNPQKWRGQPNHSSRVRERTKIDIYRGAFDRVANDESGNKYPRTVLHFPTVAPSKILHPTQKPIPLLEYLIKTYTNLGDIVLDNVMGSGTTLVAADRLGRKAIGVEQQEHYCQVAIQRFTQESFLPVVEKMTENGETQQ